MDLLVRLGAWDCRRCCGELGAFACALVAPAVALLASAGAFMASAGALLASAAALVAWCSRRRPADLRRRYGGRVLGAQRGSSARPWLRELAKGEARLWCSAET